MRKRCVTSLAVVCMAALWHAPACAGVKAALAPTGVLRAALVAANPVLVSRSADGVLGGVSVELARALAAELGVSAYLIPYPTSAGYNKSIGKGKWDIGLAARNPSRGKLLAFSDTFMEVDNGYAGRPGLALKKAEEVDRPGIKVGVVRGTATDSFLTRSLKHATLVRLPWGLAAAREALASGKADVYANNTEVATRVADKLPGAFMLQGRFHVVDMAIGVPKGNAAALAAVNAFLREAKRRKLIAQAIARAGLHGVRQAP